MFFATQNVVRTRASPGPHHIVKQPPAARRHHELFLGVRGGAPSPSLLGGGSSPLRGGSRRPPRRSGLGAPPLRWRFAPSARISERMKASLAFMLSEKVDNNWSQSRMSEANEVVTEIVISLERERGVDRGGIDVSGCADRYLRINQHSTLD